MQYIPDGTEIVLWGLGGVGKQVLAGEFGNYKISFAVDQKWMQRQMELDEMGNTENIAVYSPDVLDEMVLGDKVLVLSMNKWAEVAVVLEEEGKHIFRDYIPYVYLKNEALDAEFFRFCKDENERKALVKEFSSGKKLCGLYGCCHMSVYKSLLLKNKQFTEEYCLLDIPYTYTPLFDIQKRYLLNMPCVYSDLSLLISGCVYPSAKLGVPDWETVKSWANEDCQVILVTNAAFKGYFPQHTIEIPETMHRLRWGDKNLNKMIQEGRSTDEILSILSRTDFYEAETVNRFYENSLKNLELSESACDIRIADYIRKYGKQKRLMYSALHPKECVMKELTIRIFEKIGLDAEALATAPDSDFSSLSHQGEFIYPSVYCALGIAEGDGREKVRVGNDISTLVEFPEYINLYAALNKPYLCDRRKAKASLL